MLSGYSKALYSSWVFYKPDHLLIDCGEGAATTLGNGGYAIEKVLLTHGHIDHISGLPSLLWSRAAGMGDNEKPLEIFYPRDDVFVADMQTYLERTTARLPFDLKWTPLDAASEIALGQPQSTASGGASLRHKRRVQTFATQHIRERLTLGYKIVETRRRLKSQWAHLSQQELRAKAQNDGPQAMRELSEDYEAPLAAFSGDTLPLAVDEVRGCELLLHEATILDAGERKHQWHATLDEAIGVGVEAEVGTLVLYHFSGRYNWSEIRAAVAKTAARQNANLPIWGLFRDRLLPLCPAEDNRAPQKESAHRVWTARGKPGGAAQHDSTQNSTPPKQRRETAMSNQSSASSSPELTGRNK